MGLPTDMACAAGREMRDYATLIEAIRDWPVPFHIAANAEAGRNDRWMADLQGVGPLPPHLTIGAKPYPELRALYARSRFVVIPLLPSDTDNGITVMTEAMAMGKAVICSRVAGQRDLLEDGVNGLFVPPQDPRALRQAIDHLWSHPEECERMGREGRRKVERLHTLDGFVTGVEKAVEEAIEEARAPAIGPHARRPRSSRIRSVARPSPYGLTARAIRAYATSSASRRVVSLTIESSSVPTTSATPASVASGAP